MNMVVLTFVDQALLGPREVPRDAAAAGSDLFTQ